MVVLRLSGFANTRLFGASQELRACRYLRAQGLQLLQRNYQCRRGEIDLVMLEASGFLVFVEIRYRHGYGYGGALASVNWSKQRRLRAAAASFLHRNPRLAHHPCRFDVIGIGPGNGADRVQFHWIKSAFV